MHRRALLCTLGSVSIAGCADRSKSPDRSRPPTGTGGTETPMAATDARATTTPSAVELVTHELNREKKGTPDEFVLVTGTAENRTDEAVEDVFVRAVFEDDEGTILGRSEADVTSLAPGRTWTFELIFPGVGDAARAVTDYALTVEHPR